MGMMEGKTPITGKNFALLQQDMINAMAPGGAATEGKVNREMVETFAAQINDVMQKFGNIKDLRAEQPQIFNQLKGLLHQIYGEYRNAATERIDDIASNYANVPNEELQATVNNKVKHLKERWNKDLSGIEHTASPKAATKNLEDMSDEELNALHSQVVK